MRNKLDPHLLDLVQQAKARKLSPETTIDVLVGLTIPLTPALRQELQSRGLNPRSEIETVLTGSIRLGDVARLADIAQVVKIEASAPLYAETASFGEG